MSERSEYLYIATEHGLEGELEPELNDSRVSCQCCNSSKISVRLG